MRITVIQQTQNLFYQILVLVDVGMISVYTFKVIHFPCVV